MSNYFQDKSISFLEMIVVILVISSYCLHLMRNLHVFFSIAPVVFSVLGAFLLFKSRDVFVVDKNGITVVSIFLFISTVSCLYSYFWYPDESYSLALGRYFYMYPFVLFLLFINLNLSAFIFILKVFSCFVLLGGFSIFYQVIFGPVSWFPESSEREGLIRYSSLVGSLTSYGIVGGLTLPIVFFVFKNSIVKWFIVSAIVAAMLFTLQKSAVVNIILFFIYTVLSSSYRYKYFVFFGAFSLLSAMIFISYTLDFSYIVATVDNVFRIRDGVGRSDVTLLQSVRDRLWSLPSVLYNYHGIYGMFFGVGLAGGSGALGMLEYPMSHNGFFDLLFIGGFLNLISFLFVLFFSMYRLYLLRRSFLGRFHEGVKLVNCLVFVYFLLVTNMLFSGVVYFHPYSGIIFYTIIFFVLISIPRLKCGVDAYQARGSYV